MVNDRLVLVFILENILHLLCFRKIILSIPLYYQPAEYSVNINKAAKIT